MVELFKFMILIELLGLLKTFRGQNIAKYCSTRVYPLAWAALFFVINN